MKKYILIILAIALVSALLVGCTEKAMTEEKDTMAAKTEAPMTEVPTQEEAPMDDPMTEVPASEEPMAEETEKPMEEEMMIGKKTEDGYIDVTPEEAMKLIESTPNLVIIDVSPKYNQGHIPGAINYYVGNGSLDEAIDSLDKDVPYLVYCHVDSASIAGARILVNAGFNPVYRLEGNYGAWVEAGFPVE